MKRQQQKTTFGLFEKYMPLHYPDKAMSSSRCRMYICNKNLVLNTLQVSLPTPKIQSSSCNRLITYFNISNPFFQQRSIPGNNRLQVSLQPSPKSSVFNVRHVKSHMSVTPGSGPRHLVFHPTLSAPWRIWNDGKGGFEVAKGSL